MRNKLYKNSSIIGFLILLVICRQYLSLAETNKTPTSANYHDFESKLALGLKLNINNLKQYQLEKLPGLGSKLAKNIFQSNQKKPLCSQADLIKLSGIGQITAEKLTSQLDLSLCETVTESHANLPRLSSDRFQNRSHSDSRLHDSPIQ